MGAIREAVEALAAGREPDAPVQLGWAVFDGLRGATWTLVQADGRVREQRYVPGPAARLGQPLPAVGLGMVPPEAVRALAALLLAQDFERIVVPPAPPALAALDVAVELSVTVGVPTFAVRCPSPLLEQVPALAAIGAAFRRVREQAAS